MNPKGVSDHEQKSQMESLWRQGWRAKAIVDWLADNHHPTISIATLSRYGQRYWSDTFILEDEVDESDEIAAAQDLLERVAAAGLGTVRKITVGSKAFPGWQRTDPDSPAVSVENQSKVRTVEIVPNQQLPLVRAPKIDVKLSFAKAAYEGKPAGWKLGAFLPDMQIGYFQNKDRFHTTHDESAIDVTHQIISYMDQKYGVDIIVDSGDNLDFPAFSKHRSAPGFLNTTQLALDRAAQEVATQRRIASKARIVWIAGNHEQRLTNVLCDNLGALVGITRAEESQPILSVPYLCRFDDYDVEFLDPWPDAELWVNDHLRFEHGHAYSSSPGATAAKHLKNGVSVGYGHIHRAELLYQTRNTSKGARTHFAGSPGCLCRLDSKAPSAKTGIDASGAQGVSNKSENWQNGMWMFWYQEGGDQLTAVEPIQIWSGWAMYRGQEFLATVDANGE